MIRNHVFKYTPHRQTTDYGRGCGDLNNFITRNGKHAVLRFARRIAHVSADMQTRRCLLAFSAVLHTFICTPFARVKRKLIKPILFNDFQTRAPCLHCHARAAETGRKRVSFVLKTQWQPYITGTRRRGFSGKNRENKQGKITEKHVQKYFSNFIRTVLWNDKQFISLKIHALPLRCNTVSINEKFFSRFNAFQWNKN